jgi:pilus assembly protein CpaD
MPTNQGFDSVHQPVVERNQYEFDLTTGPDGATAAERQRLLGWFEAMRVKYGDKIALDDPQASHSTRNMVETLAAKFGMLVSNEVPVTKGYVGAGTARVVIIRTTAHVPGCPDWSASSDSNFKNATSSNFGCATNSNLAAMIANPDDLLHGAQGSTLTNVGTSDKAIGVYNSAQPSGKNGINQTSSKGG